MISMEERILTLVLTMDDVMDWTLMHINDLLRFNSTLTRH